MTGTKLILALVLTSLLFLAGCKERYSWYQINTITIQTPNGPVSGTGTERVKLRISPNAVLSGPLGWTYWGEGAVVDLGNGKFVFALIELGTYDVWDIRKSYHPDVRIRIALDRLELVPRLEIQNGKPWFNAMMDINYPIELDGPEIPTLVAFKDINDPSTITELKSQANFHAVFGEGYSFVKAELEVVKEAKLQSQVLQALPWVAAKRGSFTLSGMPCDVCNNGGKVDRNPYFGDVIGVRNFIRTQP
ncbi:MAG: hypothetical protein ACRBBS_03125 [Thalassovita sp.]